MVSPELETLDQLLAGPMPLAVIRRGYSETPRFIRGILGLLDAKEVDVLHDGSPAPRWRRRHVLEGNLNGYQLVLTDAGERRIC